MTAVMEHRVELYSRRSRRLVLFGTLGIRHAFNFVRGADMSGVAQGSILEPDLWNASNNNLVKVDSAWQKSRVYLVMQMPLCKAGLAIDATGQRMGFSKEVYGRFVA